MSGLIASWETSCFASNAASSPGGIVSQRKRTRPLEPALPDVIVYAGANWTLHADMMPPLPLVMSKVAQRLGVGQPAHHRARLPLSQRATRARGATRSCRPFPLRAFLASFARPLAPRDFVFTLLSRLMVFLAFTLLGSYLLFSLHIRLHAPISGAARGVTTFQPISTSVLAVAALFVGKLVCKTQRLKPCAIAGTPRMAVGLAVLVAFPTWSALWPAAALFGTGFGCYLGIDILRAGQHAHSANERGKDLGIISTAIFLPLILTPLIVAFILNVFQENFAALFSVAVVASLLAALLALPIRSVC